jgi:hypothetical protein
LEPVAQWRAHPQPHLIARHGPRPIKTVVMKYLDNLIAWGVIFSPTRSVDQRGDTALHLAADMRGQDRSRCRRRQGRQTYDSLEAELARFPTRWSKSEPVSSDVCHPLSSDVAADVGLYLHSNNEHSLLGYRRRPAFKIRNYEHRNVRQLALFERRSTWRCLSRRLRWRR